MKKVYFVGSSRDDLKDFPREVKESFGYDLYQIECGLIVDGVVALKGGAYKGVCELKKAYKGNAYRALYVAKLKSGIYVLHCFQKKSTKGIKTPAADMNIIKARYQEAIEEDKRLNKQKE